eukprot:CAMPEP_0119051494 /NCGR_PEP_ID=MMETSP1177-20130426/73089_1 /TAXON_ID=2985 /ORGANISM="Ochromonas sp, Strain CCMP1899" /LENGTH=434 /DNA_ID=CAMNT_0007030707 /DNA_START=591 /DNA_END=1895 /DNA_ORIENTATION=-
MAVLMFIVLVSILSVTCGQGSGSQMRGNRDLSSSDAVVKEGNSKVASTAGNRNLQSTDPTVSRVLYYSDSSCTNLEYGIAFQLNICYQHYPGGSVSNGAEKYISYSVIDRANSIETTGIPYEDRDCKNRIPPSNEKNNPIYLQDFTESKLCALDNETKYYVKASLDTTSPDAFPTDKAGYTIVSDYKTQKDCRTSPMQSYYLKTGVCQTAPHSSLFGKTDAILTCSAGGRLSGTTCSGEPIDFGFYSKEGSGRTYETCPTPSFGSSMAEAVQVCKPSGASSTYSATVVQVLNNVPLNEARGATFQAGFKNTIATVMSFVDVVTINSVSEVQTSRKLLATGVKIDYTVQATTTQEEMTQTLNAAVKDNTFTRSLQMEAGTDATATSSPEVFNMAPTMAPTSMPTGPASNSGISNLKQSNPMFMIVFTFIGIFYVL